MAAPIYSPYVSVALAAREVLGTGNLDGDWLTNDELLRRVLRRVLSTPQTYRFDRVSAGTALSTPPTLPRFMWRSAPSRYTYLLDISFTGLDDCTYAVGCEGTVAVSAGTDTRTYLDVTGSPVAFNLLMVDLLSMIATDKCKEVSQTAGGGSFSPQQVHQQALDMAAIWQGVQCA